MDQDNTQKERYFVAVKVFLEKDGELLILKDSFGDWDLPGGRIKKDEFERSLEQVIRRKISEELGPDIKYDLDNIPKVIMRHSRKEQTTDGTEAKIFALGYMAKLVSGHIQLSEAHTDKKWVNVRSFVPEDYFKGGWLQGIRDYMKMKS